jgi:hypothetical protein
MRTILAAGLGVLVGIAAAPGAIAANHGGVNWSVNIGVPGPVAYSPPIVYQPRPVYIQPQPVYVQPRPIYVQPAPVYYTGYGRPYYGYPGHWHRHHHHWRH